MFNRVLIANRGAVARRIVRACRSLGVESVCVHSDLDTETPAVEEANSSARLPGYKVSDTYLNYHRIVEIAKNRAVDAIHPGYGFLAESVAFARAVIEAGMVFIGPSPEWMALMSEKTEARNTMKNKGMPMHPGSGLIESEAELSIVIEEIGYPMIIKPVAGGGGIGMSIAENEDTLISAFRRSQDLARRNFGVGAVYAEQYLTKPRHIEFQVLGDGAHCICIGERDCSVQRRHQKLIEEAPVPYVNQDALDEAKDSVTAAIDGYDNIGTVECLYSDEQFGFLEMNTRLQVEHGVTEESLGVDLVTTQIRLAAGEKLAMIPLASRTPSLHAVEVRLYAEDSKSMLPSTGLLQVFEPPTMEGVRVDAAYTQGNFISPYYDPLLAKLIAVGTTREEAIARVTIALKAFAVSGVKTNSQLLQDTLGSEAFILGRMHTGLLEDLL